VKLTVKSAIQEVQEMPQQGKTTLKTINDYAVGAGTVVTAGILGSVFIFRKGGICKSRSENKRKRELERSSAIRRSEYIGIYLKPYDTITKSHNTT
jgi:hypothetical protein